MDKEIADKLPEWWQFEIPNNKYQISNKNQ